MKGKLWVDVEHYHWLKVEAEVIHTVTFVGFLARVGPGTQFELEKQPVGGGIWLPQRFEERVSASVLFWQRRFSTTDLFSGYRRDLTAEAGAGSRFPGPF